jgi:hypothetical protein
MGMNKRRNPGIRGKVLVIFWMRMVKENITTSTKEMGMEITEAAESTEGMEMEIIMITTTANSQTILNHPQCLETTTPDLKEQELQPKVNNTHLLPLIMDTTTSHNTQDLNMPGQDMQGPNTPVHK